MPACAEGRTLEVQSGQPDLKSRINGMPEGVGAGFPSGFSSGPEQARSVHGLMYPLVTKPVAVRYEWGANPACNL
jgi:hypothetical protein